VGTHPGWNGDTSLLSSISCSALLELLIKNPVVNFTLNWNVDGKPRWVGTWREYVPSGWAPTVEGLVSNIPTIGSAKPASGKVEILIIRPADKGTTCIASLSRKVNAEALTSRVRRDDFIFFAAMLFRRIGNYALLGANAQFWPWRSTEWLGIAISSRFP